MTLPVCITELRAKGTLDDERAARFGELYEAKRAQYSRVLGEAAAAARATADTLDAVGAELLERKRQAVLQVAAQKSIVKNIADHMAAGGRADEAAIAHFDMEQHTAGISNLDARKRAIMGQAHAKIAELLHQFDRNVVGKMRNPAALDNLVREAFGEDSGDLAARELFHAWRDAAEGLRQRFNAAGGHIGKREDWGLPQAHLSLKVRQASFDEWHGFIRPLLDPAKMIDEVTGQPFTGPGLDAALRGVYDNIRSDGWASREAGSQGSSRLANQRADARFLIFKDAEGWRSYQSRFGLDSPFDAMMGHIDGMARDIAQMEILGPAPSVTVKWLTDLLEQDAKVSSATGKDFTALVDRASVASWQIRAMHGIFSGETNRPVNSTLARGFSTWRALQTAAKLGGAAISAVTDLGFQEATARFNGLDYGNIIGNIAKLLNPLDASDREFAIHSGLVAEEAAQRMGSLWRYDDMVNTPEIARRLANGVLRVSGLSAWTQAGKWAFGMEFMHAMGRAADTAHAELAPAMREALARYGIGAAEWQQLQATPRYEHKGAKYLRPEEVTDPALATKLLEMLTTEARFAVPESSLRARAIMAGNLKAGTVTGELWRSVMQFKAFPVSMLLTHGLRAVTRKSLGSKAAYVANVAIMTTAFGALALQMKQVLAGKDPRNMDDAKFWSASFAQGGGAGLMGDFLYSDTNRYGGNAYQTLAGPLVGTAIDAVQLAKEGGAAAIGDGTIGGKRVNFGRDALRFAQANVPGSSLWYTRLAMQRLFLDQVQQEIDPDHAHAFARMEARARKDFDQSYYWAPGETAPDRAPDFTAIDGGSQ